MFNFLQKTRQALDRTRQSWVGKLTDIFDRKTIPETIWQELEELLISGDVGVETTVRLVQKIRERTKAEKLTTGEQVRQALKQEIANLLQLDKEEKPATGTSGIRVILVVGVNGSGKTTSIAKLAYVLKQEGRQILLVAADTFRAAAIEQLKKWAERIDVPVVAHQPGADPGAVVFDAFQAAKKRKTDTIIVDTAGRLHTKYNLMEELKKIKRVASRLDTESLQEVLLVIDATTGQNGLTQARHFTDAVGVTGIILAKLDSTAKGGIVLSICDQLKIPIKYIGTGETLEDLAPFDARSFVEALTS